MPVINYNWKQAEACTPGRTRLVRSIILHSSDGHRQGDIDTLTGEHVSAHWYVDKALEVWHFVDDADTAWHAGVVCDPRYSNAASIGIEQEHIDGAEPWPDALVRLTAQLVAALKQKHGPLLVRSHAAAAAPPGRKVDPQDYPWDLFHTAYQAAMREEWTFKRARGMGDGA